jgi:hypothetical protein
MSKKRAPVESPGLFCLLFGNKYFPIFAFEKPGERRLKFLRWSFEASHRADE